MTSDDKNADVQATPRGAEIPVPKRADVFADLRKAAKAGEGDQERTSPSPEG